MAGPRWVMRSGALHAIWFAVAAALLSGCAGIGRVPPVAVEAPIKKAETGNYAAIVQSRQWVLTTSPGPYECGPLGVYVDANGAYQDAMRSVIARTVEHVTFVSSVLTPEQLAAQGFDAQIVVSQGAADADLIGMPVPGRTARSDVTLDVTVAVRDQRGAVAQRTVTGTARGKGEGIDCRQIVEAIGDAAQTAIGTIARQSAAYVAATIRNRRVARAPEPAPEPAPPPPKPAAVAERPQREAPRETVQDTVRDAIVGGAAAAQADAATPAVKAAPAEAEMKAKAAPRGAGEAASARTAATGAAAGAARVADTTVMESPAPEAAVEELAAEGEVASTAAPSAAVTENGVTAGATSVDPEAAAAGGDAPRKRFLATPAEAATPSAAPPEAEASAGAGPAETAAPEPQPGPRAVPKPEPKREQVALAVPRAAAPAAPPRKSPHPEGPIGAEEAFVRGADAAAGRGVPKSDAEALKWYRIAAAQGYAPAENNLGFMYAEGRGVPRDDREAVKWYKRAAARKYPPAETGLGMMYAAGRGVKQSDFEALALYSAAANQGYGQAKANLAAMYGDGRGVERDIMTATFLLGSVRERPYTGSGIYVEPQLMPEHRGQ